LLCLLITSRGHTNDLRQRFALTHPLGRPHPPLAAAGRFREPRPIRQDDDSTSGNNSGALIAGIVENANVPSLNLRHTARAIILTEDHHALLCRHHIPDPPGGAVWTAPGGGIESGETPLAALRRELHEEVGLTIDTSPPHVWRREVIAPGYVPGYDGAVHDYFLVRTPAFIPRGALSDDELAAENISELRWWSLQDIIAYRGPDLFGPRDLGALLMALVTHGVPAEPISLDL
jgi:8-oxo-dGTP diphosphatase